MLSVYGMNTLSFDTQPTLYWLLGLGGLVLLSGFTLLPYFKPTIKIADSWFLLLTVTLLVMMRLPVILFNQELDPDESQNISHAITLWTDPVYWRSVDGTTIGPIDQYILLIPKLFGLPFDYTSARWVGLTCVIVAILFFYFSAKLWFGQSVAGLALLPCLALLGFTQHSGFVHYTSEHVPMALLSVALWFFARIYTHTGSYHRKFFWLGLFSGMAPFGKLQAIPALSLVVFFALVWLYRERRQGRVPSFERAALLLLVGVLLFPLIVSVLAGYTGVFQDFIKFYFGANLVYGSGQSLWVGILNLPKYVSKVPEFQIFIVASLLLVAVTIITSWWRKPVFKTSSITVNFCICFLLASLYAVLKPGNEFTHYLLWLIFPVSLLNAWLLSELMALDSKSQRIIAVVWCIGILLAVGFQGAQAKPLNQYPSHATFNRQLPESLVSKTIKKYVKAGDTLVVWGWMCRYYVETQTVQGAAENHTERCIFEHSMRNEYRGRFLTNIQRTKPKVFVDAVGKNNHWVTDRATQGHECFGDLGDFVKKHYLYLGMVDDTRIYVRKSRVKK